MQDQETVQEAVLAGRQAGVGRAGGLLPAVETHEVAVKQLGQWRLVWRRFTRHRLALAGVWILLGIVILAIVGPWFAPPTLHTQNDFLIQINRGQPPRLWPLDLNRLMGTDYYTNPVSGYVLAGARPALTIGLLGAFIASVIGIIIGSIAGYFGRFVDTLLMRLTDAFLTVPFFPLIALLTYYLPEQTPMTFAILMGVVGWGGVARLVRSYVLSLGQREFAEAARALGVSDLGIIFRHLLPNALDILIVSFTLNIALFLVTAANLGSLGPWVATMGIGYDALNWWQVIFPGFCLLLTIVSVNFLGDGLRDAFDTTSSGALIRWKDRPERERGGKVWQAMGAAVQLGARPLLIARSVAGAVSGAVSAKRPNPRWMPSGVAAPTRGNRVTRPVGRLTDRVERLPIAIRMIPPLAVILALMPVFLLGHSPLRYAPHFTTPQPLITEEENTDYGAHPLPHGAWTLFAGDPRGAPTFSKVAADGRVILSQRIAVAGNELSMASRHGWALGVWINPDSTRVIAAFLGKHRGQPFPLVPPGGQVDHPYVTVAPGGFDVVFQWQPAFDQRADYRIYLAYVRRGADHPSVVRRIAATPDYGFYPRAVIDGSGALDVLYLSRVKVNQWSLDFRRFQLDGTPVGRARTVGLACYGCQGQASIVPPRWEIDMKRAPDGSIWAVWDNTVELSDLIYLAHWDRNGHLLLAPQQLSGIAFDSGPTSALALALFRHGGQLYYTGPNPDGGVGSVTMMQAFDGRGNPLGVPQRVNYDSGGSSSLPRAGTIRGHAMVVWARVRAGPTFLEASSYHAHATPPDLLVRLGLNVGTPWINVGLLLVGALAGGFGIAIVNIFLLLILVALWLPIGRIVPRPLRWPVYFAALAGVIVDVFGVHGADPPQWVIMISGLGSPENWAAVAGAIAVTGWAGLFLFRRVEPLFRAAAMSFTAVYVMAMMYAVIFIQGELTRI